MVFTIIDGSTYLLITVYFWLISNHWVYIVSVGYVLQLIGLPLSWFLPESPSYLISVGKYEELISTFSKIARHNKV